MNTLQNVQKSFGTNPMLRDVTLSSAKDQSMVIIGGSGTGKSVALKGILGRVTPRVGTITVDGKDTRQVARDAYLADFGRLFQGAALFESPPVWQTVAFRLLRGSHKRPLPEARAIADTVAMLHDGVIKWTGRVIKMNAASNPYLDQFIHGRATGPIEALR